MLEYREYEEYGAERKPQQVVFLLHGYGSNQDDLITLAPDLVQYLPNALFISPNAPQALEHSSQRGSARQWFSLVDRSESKMLAGLNGAFALLEAFIKEILTRYGLSMRHAALFGFSQGAMLSLHAGLRMTPAIQAILAYSGALIGPAFLKNEIKARPNVLLVHGVEDDVIEIGAMELASDALQNNGVETRALLCSQLAHGIDAKGMKAGGEFLRQAFA